MIGLPARAALVRLGVAPVGTGTRRILEGALAGDCVVWVGARDAKGLTGEGYKGHVFWDTDIFQLPFFAAVRPDIARRIVEYRVLTLDAARRNAEAAGMHGAWYALESAASTHSSR